VGIGASDLSGDGGQQYRQGFAEERHPYFTPSLLQAQGILCPSSLLICYVRLFLLIPRSYLHLCDFGSDSGFVLDFLLGACRFWVG